MIGALAYLLPAGRDWEEQVGLDFLFEQRGVRSAPAEVVVVPIERSAAVQLGLENDPSAWPREVHARLVTRLTAAGAAVIAFDIFFKEARDRAGDQALVQAMRRAGNVVVFGYLQREREINGPLGSGVDIVRLVPPMADIAASVRTVAPFALPKLPVQVSRFWTFHPLMDEVPTLPAAALQAYVVDAQPLLADALSRVGLSAAVPPAILRERLRKEPELVGRVTEALTASGAATAGQLRHARAWLNLYQQAPRPYLNFYGPPRTLATLSYVDLLHGDPQALAAVRDKVVFVGFAESRQPEQRDGFITVYSQADGLDLSGVEIAATAFANLLHDETLRHLSVFGMVMLALAYGFMAALVGRLLPAAAAIVGQLLLAVGLVSLSLFSFESQHYWLPFMVPVWILSPLALLAGLLLRYRQTHAERARVREAFGYYVPHHVVDQLAQGADQVRSHRELTFGICLATDAERYTSLAETLTPQALSALMNTYYETLFAPVRRHGGVVSDVVGDAMLAIWSGQEEAAASKRQACLAALEIRHAETAVSSEGEPLSLRTRIGLHCGEMMVGNVGALDHFEYRAVGDMVNVASRIQGLNKYLGTRVLVSEQMMTGVDGFITRPLGAFLLVGKSQPLVVRELMALEEGVTAPLQARCEAFATAMSAFSAGQWARAHALFTQYLSASPEDGPARYFLARCEQYITAPPGDWRGVIALGGK